MTTFKTTYRYHHALNPAYVMAYGKYAHHLDRERRPDYLAKTPQRVTDEITGRRVRA